MKKEEKSPAWKFRIELIHSSIKNKSIREFTGGEIIYSNR